MKTFKDLFSNVVIPTGDLHSAIYFRNGYGISVAK